MLENSRHREGTSVPKLTKMNPARPQFGCLGIVDILVNLKVWKTQATWNILNIWNSGKTLTNWRTWTTWNAWKLGTIRKPGTL